MVKRTTQFNHWIQAFNKFSALSSCPQAQRRNESFKKSKQQSSSFAGKVSTWSPSTWWECCAICLWHKPTKLAHSFWFCSCGCFCIYSPFNSIPFHQFSQWLSTFSLCCSGLISAFLVLSSVYHFMKVSLCPDLILCSWPILKHQWTNCRKKKSYVSGTHK